ncbi:MAG: DUF4019 domain-containing protein [Terriglobales bacterium]
MKRISIAVLFAVLVVSVAFAQSAKETAAADSAKHWLALVDAGKYAASWDEAAPHFKSAVSKEQWTKALQATRAPLGNVASRQQISATYTTSLPGAPDGEYVVIQFKSSFEHKKSAVETVTPMLDKNGQWRVSGYFIK